MRIVKPKVTIEPIDRRRMLMNIERAGRTCYKSEKKVTPKTASEFVRGIIRRRHESVIEHEKISVRIVCDRGISHEIVRHRLMSFSQESTRYVNYRKCGIEIIHPAQLTRAQRRRRELLFRQCQEVYEAELAEGQTPQIARGVLPTALKTELVVTANLREWRHFFRMRSDRAAHPQMREVSDLILARLRRRLPEIFDSLVLFSDEPVSAS